MRILSPLLAAALAAALFSQARAAEPAASQFQRLAAVAGDGRGSPVGQSVEVEVDLAASPGFRVERGEGGGEVHFPMVFNNIAEGWSWQPQADPEKEDYYRFKFLPLQSEVVEKGNYEQEDKIGVPQAVAVTWRYDYFLAFENIYEFFSRGRDDDEGFAAHIPATAVDRVGMRAVGRLVAPVVSESTTFWKATYGKPVDFTLKKRYFVVRLEEIRFYDRESGEVLAALKASAPPTQR